ncbi:receptor activity-modifying protein 1-like [Thunnus albacares]|uniref:receptor activity-modifying protein 1-like n=1 Tax=Thunnus maccoyii TaxID=8240 RepID=UPI001C4D88D2|nr:receptor activity-modifying protein 1-like [Thunnus maccoyii]XP_044201292.1 receptor activity-modifying protein 1-like [Thunnus albacares]
MALESASLLKAGLVLLMAAQVLPSVSACNRGGYEKTINDLCLEKFKVDLRGLDQDLWCSWPDTTEIYEGLTNCTFQEAMKMDCFWPNQIVDRFFMQIHQTYFHDCPLTGRLLHDPPISILAPFIAVPVLVTLLMTALVVWRSKRTKGVL